MSSPFRKALLYLGLGPDEEYDDYGYDDQSVIDSRPASRPRPAATTGEDPEPDEPPVHVVRPEPEPSPMTPDEPSISALRPVPAGSGVTGPSPMETGAVRPIPVSSAKPQIVIPADFNDAQQLGDRFKNSQPVIINLQGADLDLARRVIDFASGLCYGLGGQMERVASQVYLLTPNDVEVSDEDRRRITERGLGRR
jgi:cell division inhibitor SepF